MGDARRFFQTGEQVRIAGQKRVLHRQIIEDVSHDFGVGVFSTTGIAPL